MGLITKIKEGLNLNDHHEKNGHVVEASEQRVSVAKKDVVVEECIVDVPIQTETADAQKTIIDQGVADVQVKQKEAIVQEEQKLHQAVEIQPVVEKTVDETEVQQIIVPVVDNQKEVSVEQRVMATDRREIAETPDEAAKAKYQAQASAHTSFVKEAETTASTHVNAPIIEEVHRKHVVHEYQPVIQRVIDHVHTVKVTQPIEEHVIAAAKVHDVKMAAPMTMEQFQKQTFTAKTAESVQLQSATSVNAIEATTVAPVAVEKVAVVEPVRVAAVEVREE